MFKVEKKLVKDQKWEHVLLIMNGLYLKISDCA